jgi:hypothetical protein
MYGGVDFFLEYSVGFDKYVIYFEQFSQECANKFKKMISMNSVCSLSQESVFFFKPEAEGIAGFIRKQRDKTIVYILEGQQSKELDFEFQKKGSKILFVIDGATYHINIPQVKEHVCKDIINKIDKLKEAITSKGRRKLR